MSRRPIALGRLAYSGGGHSAVAMVGKYENDEVAAEKMIFTGSGEYGIETVPVYTFYDINQIASYFSVLTPTRRFHSQSGSKSSSLVMSRYWCRAQVADKKKTKHWKWLPWAQSKRLQVKSTAKQPEFAYINLPDRQIVCAKGNW